MASDAEKELDLGPIKERVIELDLKSSWDEDVSHTAVIEDMCDLIREVEWLRDEVTQRNKILDKYVEEFGYINSLWSE